jgi:hypothetical protein
MLEKAQHRDAEAHDFEKEMKKFGEILLKERSLLEALDRAPDEKSLIDLYCRLARERGISFQGRLKDCCARTETRKELDHTKASASNDSSSLLR